MFSKINYRVQDGRKKNQREREYAESSGLTDTDETSDKDAETSKAIEWLRINTTPWRTVLAMWEQSFEGRRDLLRKLNGAHKLIESFPQLKDEAGFQLVCS